MKLMKKNETRRQEVVETLADHLLAHGLHGAHLRPLAAAAGTSDRMLLHYFKDKEDLLTATLMLISGRLLGMLENARLAQMPFPDLVPHLVAMVRAPLFRPYMRLWFELVARAAGEEKYYQEIARRIFDGVLQWISAALKVGRDEDREALASLALTTIEGCILLDALGYESQITRALEGLARLPLRKGMTGRGRSKRAPSASRRQSA